MSGCLPGWMQYFTYLASIITISSLPILAPSRFVAARATPAASVDATLICSMVLAQFDQYSGRNRLCRDKCFVLSRLLLHVSMDFTPGTEVLSVRAKQVLYGHRYLVALHGLQHLGIGLRGVGHAADGLVGFSETDRV